MLAKNNDVVIKKKLGNAAYLPPAYGPTAPTNTNIEIEKNEYNKELIINLLLLNIFIFFLK